MSLPDKDKETDSITSELTEHGAGQDQDMFLAMVDDLELDHHLNNFFASDADLIHAPRLDLDIDQ
jgi:hypothetical protein